MHEKEQETVENQNRHGQLVASGRGGANDSGESRVAKLAETISELIPGNRVVKQVSFAVGGLKDFLQTELRERRAHELKMHKMDLDYNIKNPKHPLKTAKQKREFAMKVQRGEDGAVAVGVNFNSDKGCDF